MKNRRGAPRPPAGCALITPIVATTASGRGSVATKQGPSAFGASAFRRATASAIEPISPCDSAQRRSTSPPCAPASFARAPASLTGVAVDEPDGADVRGRDEGASLVESHAARSTSANRMRIRSIKHGSVTSAGETFAPTELPRRRGRLSMQLLVYTDYALRVLLYLGAHADTPTPAAEIAAAYGISADHVAKAAKALTRHGYLRAVRGAGGGVQLAKDPSQIRVGSVVRLFEVDRGPVACLRKDAPAPACAIAPACKLRHAFARAEAAFYRELDAHTLADLLENRPRLLRLLRS